MKYILLLFSCALFFLTGCTSVTETIYLQDIKVSGPVNNPPIHITSNQKAGDITVSPRITINSLNSLSGRVDGHTFVDSKGNFRVDTVFNDNNRIYVPSNQNNYEFKGKNVKWNMPNVSAAIDIDLAVSNKIALFGGLNYSVQNQTDLIGGTAGIGIFTDRQNYGFRLDAGISWQQMNYDASSVVVTEIKDGPSNTTYVDFFRDRNKSSDITFFGSFTYNTKLQNFPLDFFINAGYFGQSLFDFKPESMNTDFFFLTKRVVDARGEGTAAFLTITPGFYHEINDFGRIMFGIRMLKETQLESSDSFFIQPVFQVDLRF
jgi:hypothetical protein